MDESDEEVGYMCTPPEIEEEASKATLNLLPEKSRNRYLVAYEKFDVWCKQKKASIINEKVLLAYFFEKCALLKSSTLWSEYSMLKATLIFKKNLDISKMAQLCAFLKRQAEGYKPKKSNIFERKDIIRFLKEAPDETYLFMKVVLIIGIAGGCRREELKNMTVDDIQDINSNLIIKIPDSKTKVERTFIVTSGPKDEGLDLLKIFRQYVALRPVDSTVNRLFLFYNKGKCTKQPVGINLIGKVPAKIATFLKLPNPSLYTGHCFRRSSATLLVDAGADITTLKRHGAWKSTAVSEAYIENSTENKVSIAKKILGEPSTSFQKGSLMISEEQNHERNVNNSENKNIIFSKNDLPFSFNISNCSNCSININTN